MTECKKCGAEVDNDFRSQLRHIIQEHPYHVAAVFLPMIAGDPYQAGAQLGEYAKNKLREKLHDTLG